MRTGKPSVSSDTRRKNSGPRRTGISRPLSPVKTGSASLKRSRPSKLPGDKSPYEYRLLQKGGTPLWIIGSAEVILDIDGEQVIQSVFLDIDSRKRAELSNRRLSEQRGQQRDSPSGTGTYHNLRVLLLPPNPGVPCSATHLLYLSLSGKVWQYAL